MTDTWFQTAVIGLLCLGIGLAFTFSGFKLFLILLPIWGFFVGFLFGAGAITQIFGDGFLATTTGWVIGFFTGLLFAVLSYLYYWFAVVFLGASVGYAIGLGILAWLGNGGGNLAGLTFGLIGAAIGAAIVIVLKVPKYLILILTAIGGAFAAVAGLALIFQKIPLASLGNGIVGVVSAVQDLNWIWPLAAVALAAVGFVYQNQTVATQEAIMMESYRNPGMPPTSNP